MLWGRASSIAPVLTFRATRPYEVTNSSAAAKTGLTHEPTVVTIAVARLVLKERIDQHRVPPAHRRHGVRSVRRRQLAEDEPCASMLGRRE